MTLQRTSGLIALGVLLVVGMGLPASARAQGPAEVQALKQEIEALRQKLATLEKQPAKVVVTSPLAADVEQVDQYVGRVEVRAHIEIRPQVGGYLAEVLVEEGQAVKRGDVLFKISPRAYQAKLDVEMADVDVAQIELKAAENLFQKKAIPDNEVALAKAKLAKAQAKAKLVQEELSSTTIVAPFDGVVGRLKAQAGSLVKEAEALTTLSDNSSVRVYFEVPEAREPAYKAEMQNAKAGLQFEFMLANGIKVPGVGRASAIEVNVSAGSVVFRADFPNPDRLLRHGQSGQVHVLSTLRNVLVIPQRAYFRFSTSSQPGRENIIGVYVVGKDDVVERREIEVQIERLHFAVVSKGLAANDRLLVDGFGNFATEGQRVTPEFRKPEEILPGVKKHE